MSKVLSDYAYYASEKIECSSLTTETYVGMDNLIPNRGGVTISEYVPSEGTTTAYKRGDILLGNIRPYFKKIWLAENDGGCSPDVLCIHCKEGVSPLFVYAVLAQDSFFDYDVAGAKGSKMPRGDKDHIMAFPVPDLDDADAIGELIDNLYKKIQNNTAVCATLEAMAKLLHDYWFVQFDFPNENGRPYKSSGGKMVWNEELKREIPEGWAVKRIGEMISTERGISYSTPNIETGNGVPMLNLATFMPGGGDYKADGLKHFLGDYPKSKVLKPYDLIMCNTQQTAVKFETDIIGRAMLVPDVFDGDVVFSHHVNVIRTQNKEFKYYLLYLFNSDYYHKYITGFTNGTNILGLSFSGVEDYLTEIPPQDILAKFGKVVLECEKKKSEIIIENQQLASLRDFLLPMLMNGQVKIGKAGE